DPPPDATRSTGDHTALHGERVNHYRSRMGDPRVAPVEDNLDAYFDCIVRSGGFYAGDEPDALTYWSGVDFFLFNGIGAVRFADGTVEERTREVLAPYFERKLPFIWWATPSGHAEALRPILTGLGLECDEVPGMYRSLDGPVDPQTPSDT